MMSQCRTPSGTSPKSCATGGTAVMSTMTTVPSSVVPTTSRFTPIPRLNAE